MTDDNGKLILPADAHRASIRNGIGASLALHVAAILLILFTAPPSNPPPIDRIIPVNLVQLGETTASPATGKLAPLPQQQAQETAPSHNTEAVPQAQIAPPSTQRLAPVRSVPDLDTGTIAAQKPDSPRPAKSSKPADARTTQQQRPLSAAEALAARLELLAQLRQPPMPRQSRQQPGRGESSTTATNAPGHARDARYAVKDLIRAQVERRWNLDEGAAIAMDWTVSIRIMLDHNGRVLVAEIVDDPRLHNNNAYRDFALSARNAVLLSSPLLLPVGAYDIAKDVVVEFDSKQVLR